MSSNARKAGSWLLGQEGVMFVFAQFLSSVIMFQLKGRTRGSLVDVDLLGLPLGVLKDRQVCHGGGLSLHRARLHYPPLRWC